MIVFQSSVYARLHDIQVSVFTGVTVLTNYCILIPLLSQTFYFIFLFVLLCCYCFCYCVFLLILFNIVLLETVLLIFLVFYISMYSSENKRIWYAIISFGRFLAPSWSPATFNRQCFLTDSFSYVVIKKYSCA
jgi:hypothetical protein